MKTRNLFFAFGIGVFVNNILAKQQSDNRINGQIALSFRDFTFGLGCSIFPKSLCHKQMKVLLSSRVETIPLAKQGIGVCDARLWPVENHGFFYARSSIFPVWIHGRTADNTCMQVRELTVE